MTTEPAPGDATLSAPSQAASAAQAVLVIKIMLRRLKLAIKSPFLAGRRVSLVGHAEGSTRFPPSSSEAFAKGGA